MADLRGEACEAYSFSEGNNIKKFNLHNYAGVDYGGNMKTRISTSRFYGESKHGATPAFDDNAKFDEADTRSSEGGASTWPTSVKSEISTETNLSFEMVVEKTHDSQHRTESSCSNSLPVVLPVSFSNQSFQETFKEAYLFRNCGSSMDSSNSKAFDRSPEEPVTASSESGVSAQIASKAIRARRNSMKMSSMAENRCSLMMKKADEEVSCEWDHERTTREDDAGEVSEQTDHLDGFNCTRKTAQSTRLSDVNQNLPTYDSGDRMKYEISEFSMTKPSKNQVKDEGKFVAGFDLNEDINPNGFDDCIQPVFEATSSHTVIHVVAKAGKPAGQPMIPLKFEGGLGWKGSAQTSAFRSASVSKNSAAKTHSTNHGPKDEQCFMGFDLNVAATEDIDANVTQLEVDSKQAKSPWIDLNCLYDASDEFTQSENRPRVDLNLNFDTLLADKSNNVHFPNPGKREFDFASHNYWANVSNLQHLGNGAHTVFAAPNFLQPVESIYREASMQPKMPFVSNALPPHCYPYTDPFHFGVGSMPYTRYYGEHPSFIAPHLGRVVHEQSTSSISASTQKFDEKTEDFLSISGSRMEDSRQFPFLARNNPIGEPMHQGAWYATPMKRKETEGGLDCYQLGYKQVT